MKKTTVVVILLTILSKSIGFIRELTLSFFYGASEISDAYIIAITIPGTIFAFFGVAIATTYIPMYNNIVNHDSIDEADLFTNNLIKVVLLISTGLILVSLIFTEEIVKLFASGFTGDTFAQTVQFTKISVFAIYFSGMISIFSGYMHTKNKFIVTSFIGIIMSTFVIVSIIASHYYNLIILPIGTLIATGLQLVVLLIYVYRQGFRFNLLKIKNKGHLNNMLYLSIPVMIGISTNQINILIDRTIASKLVVGGISALNYASKVNMLIQGIFVMALITVMYPTLTRMFSEDRIVEAKRNISSLINAVNLLVVPSTIGIMIFSNEFITLMFGRGSFDINAIKLTASALYFYSIGMVAFGLREVLTRVFFSMQDTKRPMINSAIGMSLNIVLNIVLSRYLGIGGLALATSISSIFTTILLFISLRKKIGSFGLKEIYISFIKVLFASSVMGIFTKLSYDFLDSYLSQKFSLLGAISIGVVSYVVIIYFMKIQDIDVIVSQIKKRFRIKIL